MTVREYFNDFKSVIKKGLNTEDPSAHNSTSAALVLAVYMAQLDKHEDDDLAAEETASRLNKHIPLAEPGLEKRLEGLSKRGVLDLVEWFDENFAS